MSFPPLLFGYFFLATAELAVGISVVSGKLTAGYMHPFVYIGARFLIAFFVLSAMLFLGKKPFLCETHPTGRLTPYDGKWLLLQGLMGGVIFNLIFYYGVNYTTATSAGIIGSALPAIITLCAYFILKERLNFSKLVALGFAVLGIVIIGMDDTHAVETLSGNHIGDFFIFIAMFPEAIYMIFAKKLSNRVTALGSAAAVNVIGLIGLFPFFMYGLSQTELSLIPMAAWNALIIGALSGILFFWAWPKGLSYGVQMTTAALFGGLMPVFTALIAYLVLHEYLTIYNIIGMLFVFISICLGSGLKNYLIKKPIHTYGT